MIERKAKIDIPAGVPFTLDALGDMYPSLRRIDRKAAGLKKSGELIRLKKGLYVAAPAVTGAPLVLPLLANHIYGPSYVSMESALRYYGLIPESVYTTISVTTGLAKVYENGMGRFSYVHCDSPYYSVGVRRCAEEGVTFLMAGPEKALCDKIIFTRGLNLRYRGEMERYLEEDLRFDIDALKDFDTAVLEECAATGKKRTSINQLINFVEYVRNI